MRTPGLLALLAILPAACNEDSSPAVGTPLSVPLVTREGVQAGTVTVSNSESTLRLDIAAQDGWTLEKVRAAAGTSLALIPQTKQGQPLPEQFPLRSKTDSVTAVHFSVPLSVEPGTELVFAVYADVRDKSKVTEQDSGMEPAWATGTPFARKPEATHFTYVVQRNQPVDLTGMFRTQTQEQWGGAASPGDAPAYLSAHFNAAFPAGVMIGMGPASARFTTAPAVLRFLPQAGPPVPLSGSTTNPLNLQNSLAGETLALALNVGFDEFDPSFSAGTVRFAELVVADPSDPGFGRSVREILDLANEFLAGQAPPFGLTGEMLLVSVQRINQNFQDGAVDLGYLGIH